MHEGKLIVIAGCMFASKTHSLISYITREQFRKRNIVCFKPQRDDRYSSDKIVSHNKTELDCYAVKTAAEIDEILEKWRTGSPNLCKTSVAIEEAQFFDPAIAPLASTLARDGFRVFVAGLDLDSFGHPFGPMPELLAYADEVIKLYAQCASCGQDANRTYRKPNVSQSVIHVGGPDDYEPRCKSCWRE